MLFTAWNVGNVKKTQSLFFNHPDLKDFPLISIFIDMALRLYLSFCRTWQKEYFQIKKNV